MSFSLSITRRISRSVSMEKNWENRCHNTLVSVAALWGDWGVYPPVFGQDQMFNLSKFDEKVCWGEGPLAGF